MKGNEISIKSAMENIAVPSDRLDQIIEDTFLDTPAPKANKRRRKWLYPAAAATLLFAGISAGTLTVSPALANYMAQLPVIGNVFTIFAEKEEGLEQYERFSEKVGLSQTSGGATISIDQAVYDGTNVTFTYTITSDKKLDSSARITGFPVLLEAEGTNAGMEWDAVEGGIAGIVSMPHLNEEAAQVNVLWEPGSIVTEQGEIIGDWKFEFAVSQLTKEPFVLDEKVAESGVTVHFTEVTVTDIAVNIAYQQLVEPSLLENSGAVEVEVIAKDNLGTVYEVPYNGGSTEAGARTREDIKWTATMRGLNPQATSLTFYPFAHISWMINEKDIRSKRIEFDALEINLIDGTHKIVKDPVVPTLPEPEELE
ncbi:DUF4179 domain-containing protein [Planococcus sp. N028]|uniref:DUF4179 domain-containing protein n=1 Tax=Planococcus shixiaomingii TaxID=3058393 RepID=A0ABT8N4X4_9BACL|nr:DUF4179 domain-containing protein [Planococcus sp. N028]MDN7242798.1 DUF4179 domain-containing protein [Planococcus sp. N028]